MSVVCLFELFVLYFSLVVCDMLDVYVFFFFFQAEDGIRDLVRSRGLGDVYKRQHRSGATADCEPGTQSVSGASQGSDCLVFDAGDCACLLYTSDAADERSSVDLGGRRIIKKKKSDKRSGSGAMSIKVE